MKLVSAAIFLLGFITVLSDPQYDENGYILYCPCMGRFGNQADHLLGALAFAKKLNRTFVVPPWIGHNFIASYRNSFSSYSSWFELDSLKKYHRSILMEDFMNDLAPHIWPPAARKVYCYSAAIARSKDKKSCPVKDGNPFGPFWDNFSVDFVGSIIFPSHLHYESGKQVWDETFPPAENIVLAFMGAPASYPVHKDNRHLQNYVEWSDEINVKTKQFITDKLQRPYVGIHLRNGIDWVRACKHVGEGLTYPFMSSPQCVGYGREAKMFTMEMCLPKSETVVAQTLEQVKKHDAKSLFIASDNDAYEDEFKSEFKKASLTVDIVRLPEDKLEIDLALLIEADIFVGSCGSSVTAFVSRKRAVNNKANFYFGVFQNSKKTEL